jgi:hypothetical protein
MVPVATWNYITQDDSVRHMGPVAQDFRSAFGLGESDRLINTVDIDGVNLAGVRALIDRTDALRAQVQTLSSENARLSAQNAAQARDLAELRARLERIEQALESSSNRK